jgi:hypothetical protein
MNRSIAFVLTVSLIALLAGCTRIPGGVAPSTIPLEPGGYTMIGPVSASDCKVNLLGLIPISGGNNLHQAIREAKDDRGADALIEVTVDLVSKYFILWSQTCTNVHATAVSVP